MLEPIFLADAMAFLGPPFQPPIARGGFLDLDLAHTTCCPPLITKMAEMVPEIEKFRQTIIDQTQLVLVERRKDLGRPGTKILLGLQNPPDDPDWPRLVQLGVRVTQIAYKEANQYGAGFASPETSLSDAGKHLLADCTCNGLILDLSHAGHQTALDVLECADKAIPNLSVMKSHGACYSVYSHLRNLTNEALIRIAKRGGVVGIATLTFALHENDNSLEPFWAHLKQALADCGPEAVMIGGDGAYCYQNPEEAAKQFSFMKAKLDPDGAMRARFPDHPLELNHSYRMHVIGEFLADKLQPEVWQGVMGKNFRQFLLRSLPE